MTVKLPQQTKLELYIKSSREMTTKQLRINHILLGDEDWKKMLTACDELGYNKSSILKNALQGYFKRYRDFYVNAGILDAKARGITSSEHFITLRDASEDALPHYLDSLPLFGQSPIDTIAPIPNEEGNKRKYNIVELSAFNFVLLRVGKIVHRDSYSQMVGRMVKVHLIDNWESVYLPQMARDVSNDYQ